MIKRSNGFFSVAVAFFIFMGYYLLHNWQWIVHTIAIIGYIIFLMLFIILGLIFRIKEKNSSNKEQKLSLSNSWFCAAFITVLFFGYIIIIQWPFNDHTQALIAYIVVVLFFLLAGTITKIYEKRKRHNL